MLIKRNILLYRVLVFCIAINFLFNSIAIGGSITTNIELHCDKLAPLPLILQQESPTTESNAFKELTKYPEFRLMIQFIAAHFLERKGTNENLIDKLRERFSDILAAKRFLDDFYLLGSQMPDNAGKDVVAIPFRKDDIEGIAKLWIGSRGEYFCRVESYEDNQGKGRDLKGENAPPTNARIERLIKDERIVEVSPVGEQLQAHKVKWIEGYVSGKTPQEIYADSEEEIEINKLFTKKEINILKAWFRKHTVRGEPIKFRIVLNNAAIGWKNSIDRSNLSHAGYRDGCVYIGHFFLKYLMTDGEDRVSLRKEVLEDHELQLLIDASEEKIEELHIGEAYQLRLKNAGTKIALLAKINTIRENPTYMWDPGFITLYREAEKMFRDTRLITEESVEDLLRRYAIYLTRSKDEELIAREHIPLSENEVIVYSSMEYAITHELPFFAGGLGALAGDHVRAASDLLPNNTLVAIGPYYRLGYLTQRVNQGTNWQDEKYNRVKIERFGEIAKDKDENDIVIDLPLPDGRIIYAKAWKVQAGRTALYFLTTNIDENNENPEYKKFLDLTYDANDEIRLVQEYVVGVGGERLLERLGLESRALHLNEGHVAFALLEKARQLLIKKIKHLNERTGLDYNIETLGNIPIEDRLEYGLSLPQALEVVRKMTGFTSHTPVSAGNQVFALHIAKKYLSPYLDLFGAKFEDIAFNPVVHNGIFDMTEFALTYCNFFNGVSRRHAEVCRDMYEESNKAVVKRLNRDRPKATHITNAVHRRFYQPREMRNVLKKKLTQLKREGRIGKHVTLDSISRQDAWNIANLIQDDEMEKVSKLMIRNGIKQLKHIRSLQSESGARILPLDEYGEEREIDPEAFIMVFGRRMAEYKEPAFILEEDLEDEISVWRAVVREARSKGKNAQILFMGKAHRTDETGKKILQKILHIAKTDPELRGTILFIEDYNTEVTQAVVKIATAALNNPKPPLEASGTSGIKFGLAGKPSITVKDGWTLEASLGVFPFQGKKKLKNILVGTWRFINRVGTQILGQDAGGHILTREEERKGGKITYECEDPLCEHFWAIDENSETPEVCEKCGSPAIKNNSYHELGLMDLYFNRNPRWYQIMRESLVENLSQFTSHRMFREYMEKMYVPNVAAGRFAEREYMNIGIDLSKGNVQAALRTIYFSELKDKPDISVMKDFFPKRTPFRETTVKTEIKMLKDLGILVPGTKPHTYQLHEEIRGLSPDKIREILDIAGMELYKIPKNKIPKVKIEIDLVIQKHEIERKEEEQSLYERLSVPDAKEEPGKYAAYMAAKLAQEGNKDKALELLFTTATFQGREENLDVPAEVLNRLIETYASDRDKAEEIKDFVLGLAKAIVEFSRNDKKSIEIAQAVQIMAGQTLNIFSWIDRKVTDAETIRLTADKDKMVKSDERGKSFINAKTLPKSIKEVKDEGMIGFYYRGVEGPTKLGEENILDLEEVVYNKIRFKGAIDKKNRDKEQNKLLMYLMDHGFINVPKDLIGSTREGVISTMHETSFIHDFLPGSSQTTSTGAGHFQVKEFTEKDGSKKLYGLLDVKQVTEGKGIQVSVRYNETGGIEEVIVQEVLAGEFCVALPGYVDYMINLGGLRFNDTAIKLLPHQAKRLNPYLDFNSEEKMRKLEAAIKKHAKRAPYIGIREGDEVKLVKNGEDVPELTWMYPPLTSFFQNKSLIERYESAKSINDIQKIVAEYIVLYTQEELPLFFLGYGKPKISVIEPDKIAEEKVRKTKEASEPPSLNKTEGISKFVDETMNSVVKVLGPEGKTDKLIRIPIESIEAVGIENIKDFLRALQSAKHAFIELYSKDRPEGVQDNYGIVKKSLPDKFRKSRRNTVTIFPVLKGEEIPDSKTNTRWTLGGISPKDTIITPVGFNYDETGIIRSIFLGLMLSEIARNKAYTKDTDFVSQTLAQYMNLCFSQAQRPRGFKDLTEQDLIDLATGDIKVMVKALNKLIKLLPIVPVNPEELRSIYERTRKALITA